MTIPDLLVFGGTFDPPHVGHLQCVKTVLKRFSHAALWVVPSCAPPASSGQLKDVGTSFKHRLAMAQLMFGNDRYSGFDRLQVSDIEMGLSQPNYTYNTLKEIRRKSGMHELALVIGEDQFRSFPNWYNAKGIIAENHLVVIARKEDGIASCLSDPQQIISQLGECLEADLDSPDIWTMSGSDKALFIVHEYQSQAASRDIRRGIDGSDLRTWLTPEVLKYIEEHKLYEGSAI